MKLYQALYNPMIHESCAGTISLHETEEGAEKAVEEHKMKTRKDWENRKENCRKRETKEMFDMLHDDDDPDEWANFQWWGIGEVEIKE